jgi:hypothetical protein
MTRWGTTFLLGLAVMVASGCGSSDDGAKVGTATTAPTGSAAVSTTAPTGADIPTCSSFYGKAADASAFTQLCRIDEATAQLVGKPIGTRLLATTGRSLCRDGRVLIWNDLGWGYEGQPFTRHADGVQQVAPETERESCRPG